MPKASEKILQSVATQMMKGTEVLLEGQKLTVARVGSRRLRMVRFNSDGREFEAIEQNPKKPSRWGELARKGHEVVQFRDVATQKYVAVSVDGKVMAYGK